MAFPKVRKPKQPPKKRIKIQALFWLEPVQAAALKKLAKRLKVSQSELARTAFETFLSQHGVNIPTPAASEAA